MTASPMRRADANRLALSGCTRRHSSRRTAFVAVVSARALRVRSAPRSSSLCSCFSSSISRACRWRSACVCALGAGTLRATRAARRSPAIFSATVCGAGSGGVVSPSESVHARSSAVARAVARVALRHAQLHLLELGAQPGQLGLDRVHARPQLLVGTDELRLGRRERRRLGPLGGERLLRVRLGGGAGAPLGGRREDPRADRRVADAEVLEALARLVGVEAVGGDLDEGGVAVRAGDGDVAAPRVGAAVLRTALVGRRRDKVEVLFGLRHGCASCTKGGANEDGNAA